MESQVPKSFKIELEEEDDGRWIAEVIGLPGVLVYGTSQEEAITNAQALALRVIADKLEHGELKPGLTSLSFNAA
jgi:predicted RNase H-like HicB family nuclease